MFRFVPSLTPASLRRLGLVVLACSAVALAGCGGGSRAKDYAPNSIVVFGDENSAFDNTSSVALPGGGTYPVRGLVYTVNSTYWFPGTAPVYCNSTVATTACASSDYSDATHFLADDATRPNGTGYRLYASDNDTKFNVVSMIAIGKATATVSGVSTANVPMKQSVDWVHDCSASTTAMQTVAHAFGKGFGNPADASVGCYKDASGAVTYATPDATVATVQTQVNNNLSSLGSGSLVIVWAGQKDIRDVYVSPTWVTLDAKRAEVKYRADALANAVKRILATGAKVLLIGVPDLGFSPYGLATVSSTGCDNVTRTDSSTIANCHGDLEKMSKDFNNTLVLGDRGLGLSGLQDYVYNGRQYAFVDAWALTQSYALNASYVNAAVCDSAKLYQPDGTQATADKVQHCTSAFSIKSSASTATYLWADDNGVHPSNVLHSAIGSQAFNQAANQF